MHTSWCGGMTRGAVFDSIWGWACDSVSDTLAQPECRYVVHGMVVGKFRGSAPRQRGAALLEGMVTRASACVRRLGGGLRSQQVRFGRRLAAMSWRSRIPARSIFAPLLNAGAAWARLAKAWGVACWFTPCWRWTR